MTKTGLFSGRSITVVNDLSLDEQLYVYRKTSELKADIKSGADLSRWKINSNDFGIYLMFLEDSTRTKESFRNAACFHQARMNDFNASASSFNKNESMSDTVKMLFGYLPQSMFIIRSRQEGVCRYLEHSIGQYAEKIGYPKPGFINAGDGKHEHPTQEFLDEFSFLEQRQGDRSHIHLAIVGDLYHGRTVHSKAEGLKVFKEVKVDLIAPPELAMPSYYLNRMKDNLLQHRRVPRAGRGGAHVVLYPPPAGAHGRRRPGQGGDLAGSGDLPPGHARQAPGREQVLPSPAP
jgi:aspartate carbamoyltransferase